jgi:hypothetical protein
MRDQAPEPPDGRSQRDRMLAGQLVTSASFLRTEPYGCNASGYSPFYLGRLGQLKQSKQI